MTQLSPALVVALRVLASQRDVQPMRILARQVKIKPQAMASRVWRLRTRGLAEKTGPECYRITAAGRTYLKGAR